MSLQDHLHLSLTLGEAPENAPDKKWYALAEDGRSRRPMMFTSEHYSATGVLRPQVLLENGNPRQLMNWRYRLLLRQRNGGDTVAEQLANLLEMQGRTVYLVDYEHPDDGQDHESYIQVVYMRPISEIPTLDVHQRFAYVDIELLDQSS